MTTYNVYDSHRNFLMTAPLTTLRKAFNLRSSEVGLVSATCTMAGPECELRLNPRGNVFGLDYVMVTFNTPYEF